MRGKMIPTLCSSYQPGSMQSIIRECNTCCSICGGWVVTSRRNTLYMKHTWLTYRLRQCTARNRPTIVCYVLKNWNIMLPIDFVIFIRHSHTRPIRLNRAFHIILYSTFPANMLQPSSFHLSAIVRRRHQDASLSSTILKI